MSSSSSSEISEERRNFVIAAAVHVASECIGSESARLSASVLSGGITNELYRVKNTESGASVVVRVYGKETERLISRSAEQFFQSKFLKTYGRHENALVYEFLDGMRALRPEELPAHATATARYLGEFQVRATNYSLVTVPFATQELHCIHVCTAWLTAAQGAVEASERLHQHRPDMQKLTDAAQWLLPLLQKSKDVLPAVISHNDLLSGNIMVPTTATSSEPAAAASSSTGNSDNNTAAAVSDAKLRFIDFEYARRDFALFDVANHWNEWAGYDNDFSQYPTAEQQRQFLRAYYASVADHTCASAEEKAALLGDEHIERSVVIANFLSLASNLAWSIWSIVQLAYSPITFDYLSYYELKLRRFEETKSQFAEPYMRNILKIQE